MKYRDRRRERERGLEIGKERARVGDWRLYALMGIPLFICRSFERTCETEYVPESKCLDSFSEGVRKRAHPRAYTFGVN